MSLRKLKVEIELQSDATGQLAKEEHLRALEAVKTLLEAKGWGAFGVSLFARDGTRIGYATLNSGTGSASTKDLEWPL